MSKYFIKVDVKLLLVLLVFILSVNSIISSLINLNSIEAIYSSIRLLVESIIVFFIVKYDLLTFNRLVKFIVYISLLNSLIVNIQVLESMGIIGTNFNYLNEYWGVREEMMRKPGFFNSILTSSYVIFFGMLLNLNYKLGWANKFVIIQFIALFFSARTFFLPCLFIIPILFFKEIMSCKKILKWSLLALYMIIFLSYFNIGNSLITIFTDLTLHFNERILPSIKVLFTGDLSQDYSSADLMNHYRLPTMHEFLFGNGYPRYSVYGGLDPTYTRWLLQVGFFSVIIIFLIHVIILRCGFYKNQKFNILLSIVLFITPFKGELTTSTLLFTLTFLYFFLGVKNKYKLEGS